MTFRLTRSRIDADAVLAGLDRGAGGGVVLFLGRVRGDLTPRGRVAALAYEAYAPLAVQQMRRLETEARRRWPLEAVLVVHRVGRVPVGEISVAVGVRTGHRAEAFRAARFLIDRLKREVPIWKRDVPVAPGRSGSPRRRRPAPGGGRAAG